jgi:ATP-dependent DNA helicase RecQ
VLATYSNERTCVLTNKNEEAARIVGLLTKQGIRAKFIQQSSKDLGFSKLAEIRYFLKQIKKKLESPKIEEDLWSEIKQKTLLNYETSACLGYLKVFFDDFEKSNPTKYWSDLMEFVAESNLEDFCSIDHQTVFVSTIHKSKGREFDTVYMLLDGERADNDEQIRKLYVGMTRAKQRLFIHCNTNVFSNIKTEGVEYRQDTNLYPLPEEITIPLTHKDVYLDYFKGKKEQILKLRSGQPLCFDDGYLRLPSGGKVACISNKIREELQGWAEKGYYVKSAKINFIVAWKGKEDVEETAVLLPELMLIKSMN